MEYNDNDYQSKNLHLTGEDSSKVSSALRPFTLPRFDFDDSLQGHLRFDGLVENEVFLGIPCQEDNQWIEDFPRGSSGIEFSSTATESCSITGRTNVWYEAASSESVEMLLKSVGQEHNLPEDTTIQESDGGNELGNVTHSMEHSLQEDDKMDYVEDPTIGVHTDRFLDRFSRSSEITDGEIGQFKCALPVAGSSFNNDANRGESPETTTGKSLQIETKSNDLIAVGVTTSHNATLVNQNEGDPHVYVILENPNDHHKINDIHQSKSGLPDDIGKGWVDRTTVNKGFNPDDGKLSEAALQSDNRAIKDSRSNVTSDAEYVKEVGDGNTSNNLAESSMLLGSPNDNDKGNDIHQSKSYVSDDFGKGWGDRTTVNKDFNMDDGKLSEADFQSDDCVIKDSMSSATSEGDHVEEVRDGNTSTNLAESSMMPGNEECDLLTPEECKENSLPTEPSQVNNSHIVVLSEVKENNHQPEGDIMQQKEQSVSFKSICASEGHDRVEVRETDVQSSNLEREKDFSTKMPYEQNSVPEQEHNAIENSSLDSELVNESNLDHRDVNGCPKNACIAAESLEETHVYENSEGRKGALRPREMDYCDGNHVSSQAIDETEKMCREDYSSKHPINASNSDQNVFSSERGEMVSTIVASVVENNKSIDYQMETGSSLVEECTEHVENAHGSEFAASIVNKQASNTEVEDANHSSHDTVDGVSLSEISGDPAALVKQCEELPLPFKGNLMHLNRKDEMDTICPAEANLLSALGSSFPMASQLGPVSDVEKDPSVPTPLAVDHSIPMIEAADTETKADQASVSSEVFQDCSMVGEIGHRHDSVYPSVPTPLTADHSILMIETDDTDNKTDQASVSGEVCQVLSMVREIVDQHDSVYPSLQTPLTADHSIPKIEAADTETKTEQASVSGEVRQDYSMVGETGHQHDSVYPSVPKPLTADVSMIEAADTETKADHASVSDDVRQDCTMVAEIGLQHDSVTEEGGNDAKETVGKHVETDSEEGKKASSTGEEESSKEQGAPNLSPAVVTTCTQLLQSDGKNQEAGNKCADDSVPSHQDTDDVGGKVQPMCMDSSVDSSKKETGKDLQLYPNSKTSEVTMEIAQPIDKATPSACAKSGSEHKIRRRSGRPGRESGRKGNQVKETPVKLAERVDNSCVHLGSPVSGQLVHFDVGSVQRSGMKTSKVVSNSTSSLPDLNSFTPLASFQQPPFTDLQQVQLRAQIFIYGSLIQGAAPDEAIMVAAFGTTDGGRSIWEPTWRSCLERLHGPRSLASSSEVPDKLGSGLKTPDPASKHDLHQSKVGSSTAPRSSSKGTSNPVITPIMPLSSPLWNIATPSRDGLSPSCMAKGALMGYHAVSPLHSYQTPPTRNFMGQTDPWLSQTPLTASWVATPQTSAFDMSIRVPVFPIPEPVDLTPVKESFGVSTGTKYIPPSSVVPCIPSVVLAETSFIDAEKGTSANAQHSTEPKSTMRKKLSSTEAPGQVPPSNFPAELVSTPSNNCHLSKLAQSCEDVGQVSLIAGSQTVTLAIPIASHHFSTPVAVVTPSFVSKSKSNIVSPSISANHSKSEAANLEKRKLTSQDLNKVEDAKLQAGEAAEHAAAALGHCQAVWSELDKQKNSGLMSDVETRLVSAAAAIAAAASVAKAAAAAAKIASNAALQERQMADEALASCTRDPSESRTASFPDFVKNMGSATPASILKGGDGPDGSGSVFFAAREAARRRIEAASAASRHAENLVAIVKAAELAAEAVSHAGKVVAIGDPMTLSELVEAGPDDYWKVSKSLQAHGLNSNDVNLGRSDFNGIEKASDVCLEKSGGPSKKALQAPTMGPLTLPEGSVRVEEGYANTVEGSVRVEEVKSPSVACAEKDMRSKGPAPELTKTPDSATKPEMDSRVTSIQEAYGKGASSTRGENIKEGCLVEVFRDNGDLNDAWFLANVLSLKDGNAFVSYTERELQSDKATRHLKEWVPLCIDGDGVPRIRAAHPMPVVHPEGVRKRRRAAVNDHSWSVGDQVDAWIHDCWREGIIIEKNKRDETTFTVNFPARGDNAVVRVWHLRPRRVWKDGQWIELFTSRDQSCSQGDTPKEKRLKLGNPASEDREKAELGTIEENKALPLSADEKSFNIGSRRNENKPTTLRTMRSGLQKEGPKVVFGIPKPGKKRKFMDVSKHNDSGRGAKATTSTNDPPKIARYGIPTRSGVGAWRNCSRTDPKEKPVAEPKPKPLKSRKPPASSRILKDNILRSTPTTSGDAISYNKSESGQSDSVKFGPDAEDVAESNAIPSEPAKKASKLKNKGNFAAARGKSPKHEPISENNEPRRSNRRIQPTSRLLEGLQSSLIIPKFPSLSHEKSQKSHNRVGASKGNSHG